MTRAEQTEEQVIMERCQQIEESKHYSLIFEWSLTKTQKNVL